MKLSIIIPAYNEEDYISQCLTSVIREKNESGGDVEIIVVNNGSRDKTKEIASSFAGVKVVDEPAKGLISARQAGFRAATGDLIAYLDADSMLTPGWIDQAFKAFNNDPEMVSLSGPVKFYDMSRAFNLLTSTFYYVNYPYYLFIRFFFKKGLIQGANFILRRSALERIGGFNPEFIFWGEDTDLARRLSRVGKVTFSPTLLVLTSGRRFKDEGLVWLTLKYIGNYFWTIFFKKPLSKHYTDVRVPK
jgi:glycosyltransferase involved in cell wall biosynthesis